MSQQPSTPPTRQSLLPLHRRQPLDFSPQQNQLQLLTLNQTPPTSSRLQDHQLNSTIFSGPSRVMRQEPARESQPQTPPNRYLHPSIHPQFKSKPVHTLACTHCETPITVRAMKAILLGDTKVELYSTDRAPANCELVESDFSPKTCRCGIRNVACLGCGNVIGYHVVQPCHPCLAACNNGHYWMFGSDGVQGSERLLKGKPMNWGVLSVDSGIRVEEAERVCCR